MCTNHSCNCSSTGRSCSTLCDCYPKEGQNIAITLSDNQTHSCTLLAKFTIADNKYLVLRHPENNQQLHYRYTKNNGNLTLEEIYHQELDLVLKTYNATLEQRI